MGFKKVVALVEPTEPKRTVYVTLTKNDAFFTVSDLQEARIYNPSGAAETEHKVHKHKGKTIMANWAVKVLDVSLKV